MPLKRIVAGQPRVAGGGDGLFHGGDGVVGDQMLDHSRFSQRQPALGGGGEHYLVLQQQAVDRANQFLKTR